jgi:hypothetical protein
VSSFLQQHEVKLVFETLGIVVKVYSLLIKGARLGHRAVVRIVSYINPNSVQTKPL